MSSQLNLISRVAPGDYVRVKTDGVLPRFDGVIVSVANPTKTGDPAWNVRCLKKGGVFYVKESRIVRDASASRIAQSRRRNGKK